MGTENARPYRWIVPDGAGFLTPFGRRGEAGAPPLGEEGACSRRFLRSTATHCARLVSRSRSLPQPSPGEPLRSTWASAPWLSRGSGLPGGSGQAAHSREEPAHVLRRADGRAYLVRRCGKGRRKGSLRKRRVVRVLERWREVGVLVGCGAERGPARLPGSARGRGGGGPRAREALRGSGCSWAWWIDGRRRPEPGPYQVRASPTSTSGAASPTGSGSLPPPSSPPPPQSWAWRRSPSPTGTASTASRGSSRQPPGRASPRSWASR